MEVKYYNAYSSTPNYHTKQHNNNTSTRAKIASSFVNNVSTAGTVQ